MIQIIYTIHNHVNKKLQKYIYKIVQVTEK